MLFLDEIGELGRDEQALLLRAIEEKRFLLQRLTESWRRTGAGGGPAAETTLLEQLLGPEAVAQLDLFDQRQLAAVLRVRRDARSLSDAGRRLFAVSRTRKVLANDADRLRKYLARFSLDWERAHG